MLNNKVKLVIWDLDETFWKGTLSEGNIYAYDQNIFIVNELTKRGIINSICSKNDYEVTKQKLIEIGVWDLFVFSSINWQPKGQQIKEILENLQLRAENTLFIDDNHLNIEEAKFYNKGLMCADPTEIPKLLDNVYLKGTNDAKMSKLLQYKILENKNLERKTYSSNDEFLKSCNIKVKIHNDLENYHERIFDLLDKTNQLNFTKKRLSIAEVQSEFRKENFEKAGLVSVFDNYGDYGIVGVFAVKNNQCEHFTFSCRILNLGIEQYIYRMLMSPNIEIVGEVASDIHDEKEIEYITLLSENEDNRIGQQKDTYSDNLLLRGGCDLEQVSYYLEKYGIKVIKEFNYNKNNVDIRRESLFVLYQSINLSEKAKKQLSDELYFYDMEMFHTDVFRLKNYTLVLSFLTEYSRGVYRSKDDPNIKILYGNFEIDITNEKNWEYILSDEYYDKKVTREFLLSFQEKYEFVGAVDGEEFERYLLWLINNVKAKEIIVLTGSERNYEKKILKDFDREENRNLHHKNYNDILRKFVGQITIIEIDEIIKDSSYFSDSIRHYNRNVYFEIANRILGFIRNKNHHRLLTKVWLEFMINSNGYLSKIKGIIRKNKDNAIMHTKNLLMVLDYKFSKNPKKIRLFHQIHKGKRCFIIGNGPSLTTTDLEKLNNEITIASNRIFNIFPKTPWRPTYYIAHDFLLLNDIYREVDQIVSNASFLPINMKWLYHRNFSKHINFLHNTEEYYPNLPKFSRDISKGIYEGYTVTYAAIQLAVYMGFKEIYLLGVDFSYSTSIDINGAIIYNTEQKDYFDNNQNTKNHNLPNIQKSYLAYLAAKEYTDKNNVNIYNATRGGKLEVFPRVDFNDLF